MKNFMFGMMTLVFAVLLISCSNGSNSSGNTGGSGSCKSGNVCAQTTYTNASLTGNYAFVNNANTWIGAITTDGNGNITSGTITYGITNSCTVSVTGTYEIQSSGAGTAILNFASGGNTPCDSTKINTLQSILGGAYNIEVSQQGSEMFMVNSNPETNILSKQ